MACSLWHIGAGMILYNRQYTESDKLSLEGKIFWSWIGIWGAVVVSVMIWKKYQEEWKMLVMINRADEFSSLFSTTRQEDLYRIRIGIYWCWWLFLFIMKKEVFT